MRQIEASILILGLALAAPSKAQEFTAESDCNGLPASAQSDCLGKLAKAADTQLNDVYWRAMNVLEKSDGDEAGWRDALKEAQQAWFAHRDMDCGSLIGSAHESTMTSPESCRLEKTEQRIRELRDRFIDRY